MGHYSEDYGWIEDDVVIPVSPQKEENANPKDSGLASGLASSSHYAFTTKDASKGGKIGSAKLTQEQRRERARKAAQALWKKRKS